MHSNNATFRPNEYELSESICNVLRCVLCARNICMSVRIARKCGARFGHTRPTFVRMPKRCRINYELIQRWRAMPSIRVAVQSELQEEQQQQQQKRRPVDNCEHPIGVKIRILCPLSLFLHPFRLPSSCRRSSHVRATINNTPGRMVYVSLPRNIEP